MMTEMDDSFQSAASRMATLIPSLPQKSQLEFYALYKQATLGSCTVAASTFSFGERAAKIRAWNGVGHLSQHEAKLAYLELYNRTDTDEASESIQSDSDDIATGAVMSRFQLAPLNSAAPPSNQSHTPSDADIKMIEACRSGDLSLLQSQRSDSNIKLANVCSKFTRALIVF